MRKTILVASSLSSWAIALIYYQIDMHTGAKLSVLLWAAIIVMVIGLYLGCQDSEVSVKEGTE